MKRVALVLMATVALMSVAFVSGAAGHKVKIDSTVSAKFNKPKPNEPYAVGNFSGSVSSQKPRCEKNRTVTLFQRAADGSTPVVGTDLTDVSGAWAIAPPSVAPGTYYATVAKRVLRKNAKHRHVCKAAVSKDVTVK